MEDHPEIRIIAVPYDSGHPAYVWAQVPIISWKMGSAKGCS
jgi:hypothetical protein